MTNPVTTFVLTVVLATLLLKFAPYNSYKSTELSVEKSGRYTCYYSTLWCSCWGAGNSGCELGCSGSVFRILYNQTECKPRDKLILSGFFRT